MARCELYAIPTDEAPGYRWRWRTLNGQAQSKGSFLLFYECVADAQANGHVIDFEATVAAAKQFAREPPT